MFLFSKGLLKNMVVGNGVDALTIFNLGVKLLNNFLMDKKRALIPIHWSTYITMEQEELYVSNTKSFYFYLKLELYNKTIHK